MENERPEVSACRDLHIVHVASARPCPEESWAQERCPVSTPVHAHGLVVVGWGPLVYMTIFWARTCSQVFRSQSFLYRVPFLILTFFKLYFSAAGTLSTPSKFGGSRVWIALYLLATRSSNPSRKQVDTQYSDLTPTANYVLLRSTGFSIGETPSFDITINNRHQDSP